MYITKDADGIYLWLHKPLWNPLGKKYWTPDIGGPSTYIKLIEDISIRLGECKKVLNFVLKDSDNDD